MLRNALWLIGCGCLGWGWSGTLPAPVRAQPTPENADVSDDGTALLEQGLPQADSAPPAEVVEAGRVEALCAATDADCDGVVDEVERATGTRALRADTDGDGVPDGEEDLSRDGVVDGGETDPRVPGLFPGKYPHIPEPMLFDLVRGLDAKGGELEVNNLAVLRRRRGRTAFLWAPEVEWAFRDGMGIELELPMDGRELEAVKTAFQAALPMAPRSLTHGVQFIGEYLLDGRDFLTTAVYIFGARMGRWSALTMFGGSVLAGGEALASEETLDPESRYTLLVNPSLFADLRENVTVGLEGNVALGIEGPHRMRIVPQLHAQLSRRIRVQAGVGGEWEGGRAGVLAASRVVLE